MECNMMKFKYFLSWFYSQFFPYIERKLNFILFKKQRFKEQFNAKLTLFVIKNDYLFFYFSVDENLAFINLFLNLNKFYKLKNKFSIS
jgi:hypothetical protein